MVLFAVVADLIGIDTTELCQQFLSSQKIRWNGVADKVETAYNFLEWQKEFALKKRGLKIWFQERRANIELLSL